MHTNHGILLHPVDTGSSGRPVLAHLVVVLDVTAPWRMGHGSSQIYLRTFCCPIPDSQAGCEKGTESVLRDTPASNLWFHPHLVGSYSQGLYIISLTFKFKSVSEAGDTNWKKKSGNFLAFINILRKTDRSLPPSHFLSCRITKRSSTVPCCHWHNSHIPLESTLTPVSTENRGTKKYTRRNQAQRG